MTAAWKKKDPQRDHCGPLSCEDLFRRDQLFFLCAGTFSQLKVETIKVHHLVPGRYEVMDELLLRVRTSVDFGKRSKLGL
jgi:hypothetical protein